MTEEEKKALLAEFLVKAKADLKLETKADIDAINKLFVDQQKAYEELIKGKMTEGDFKTYEAKAAEAEKKHQERIDAIETKMNRLPIGGGDQHKEPDIEAKAFDKWLRFGRTVLTEPEVKALRRGSTQGISAEIMKQFDIPEEKVLTIGGDTGISYLAPGDYEQRIIKGITEISPIRGLADVKPCSGDFSEIPKRTGQFAAVWVGEIGSKTETTGLTYGMEKIPNHELYALVKVSKRSLEDSRFNLEAELTSEFTEQLAKAEATAFVGGDRIHKPEGFLVNPTVNSATIVYDHSDTKMLPNGMIDLLAAPKSAYASSASLVANRATIAYLRKMHDANSKYYWEPDWQVGTPGRFMGVPIVEVPDMPANADGAFSIAFGDFRKGYVISDRVTIEIQRLVELYAESGQIGFIARKRVGGQVVLAEAIYIGKGQA